jgi:hypothetical protein
MMRVYGVSHQGVLHGYGQNMAGSIVEAMLVVSMTADAMLPDKFRVGAEGGGARPN